MITILGIRHHGVGSAKNVLEMLHKLQPDLVMVEGPPELGAVMQWIGDKALKPPVSVLCYDENEPKRAAFYPFAEFSPEWQAVAFANQRRIPVRMIDLPIGISWEIERRTMEAAAETQPPPKVPHDPMAQLAMLGGYADSELWWEHHFEQRYQSGGAESHFEAAMLAMKTLRDSEPEPAADTENLAREAYMAQLIRQAQNEVFSNIVVVCGAWHAPALLDLDGTEKAHAKILKSLPKSKIKVGTTWVPWTNDRLSMFSGYGAGITSPGWYTHRWRHPADRGERWLAHVARVFRKKKMDISTAHIIEGFRLAESLAGLRDLARPGLFELNEATQTVMCMGDGVLLELVKSELIVGHALGKVPPELPKLPLQADFEEQVRKARLPQTAEAKELKLDLRNELDLRRSVLLFRCMVLGVNWAKTTFARSKGTFKEAWRLAWSPEMMLQIIEKGIWGNTVKAAANSLLLDRATQANNIGELAKIIEQAIPAELFEAIEPVLKKINDLAAVSADIAEMMAALGPLADTARYGNVRQTDLSEISALAEGVATRICIGLPNACYGLDEAAATQMFGLVRQTQDALRLLENPSLAAAWAQALRQIMGKDGVPALLRGCVCRLLSDSQSLENEEIVGEFARALSVGNEPSYSAGWLEGFLGGSGMMLLYDDKLWNLVYRWVAGLQPENFVDLLPVLRRTFSKFEPAERRSLGEKARRGAALAELDTAAAASEEAGFDHELGLLAMAGVAELLGLPIHSPKPATTEHGH